ncbi:radical SAM protein [Sphingomonas sp. ASY06-1R]|uniref:radical SAM protein n=1 Tax=Sphingomonas sp. ASY06-1R TaxID=3445771 RepID=UPI003FA1D2AE
MIVLWRTTTHCNYACGFCAYDRRLGGIRRSVPAEEAARFGTLLADWARQRGQTVLLSWLGGEPLSWRPIWDLSARLAQAGLAISATTNGSSLDRADVRAALIASFRELTVSIDGPPSVHDALRGREGAWARVRSGLHALAAERGAAPLRLRANIVLMRQTLPHFAALCRQLADWGVDEITFNQLGGRDRPAFFPAQRLLPADIADLAACLPGLKQDLKPRGVTLCGDALYVERLAASADNRALAVEDCGQGRPFLFIDEAGIAAPCSFSGAAYGIPIAGLRTVADVDGLAARFAAARTARRLATCDDCPSTQQFAKFAA